MSLKHQTISIIGGGLAGAQAALTIAGLGGRVRLREMRPLVQTPAHKTTRAAELVCSNSLRSNDPLSAPGLLKEELRRLGAELIHAADEAAIPGGSSLTVDREQFSERITELIEQHPLIEWLRGEVTEVPDEGFVILSTGPLTSDGLAASIQRLTGEQNLFFHDAIAPVVDAESIDQNHAFRASRYDKGGGDFLNCPLTREEYLAFHEALTGAEGIFQHEFEELNFFGCPPLEKLARAGVDTLRFGPMKPVGLTDPRTGRRPYAVLQLRQENLRSDSYNLVGFQNQLKFGEQERVFRLIPALARAEFIRFGQMHRNTYVRAPALLTRSLNLRSEPRVFLAGQLAGVEGYVEAMATGWIAGANAWRAASGSPALEFPRETAMGSITHYLTGADADGFAPVRITFDLLPPLPSPESNRLARRARQCERALAAFREFASERIDSVQAAAPHVSSLRG